MTTEETIAKLKRFHGAKTDQDLAKLLHLSSSTVGSWRARGSVPERYLKAMQQDNRSIFFGFRFDEMSEQEELALCLALMLLMRDHHAIVTDQREFLTRGANLSRLLARYYQGVLPKLEGDSETIADGIESYRSIFDLLVYDTFFSETKK